ncbi:MAG: calcium-transporting P-type ATPase, PMR1-type [Bacillota bacterium]
MDTRSHWCHLAIEEVMQSLSVDPRVGLSASEVAKRQQIFGANTLPEKKPPSPLWVFLEQFKDFMVLVLLGATLISGLLGEYEDAITIILIVIVNAILGFVQEMRAERALEALKKLTAQMVEVLRDGARSRINAAELVPGDIMILDAGDRVAADGRLVEVTSLEAEEAALTGESQPVSKQLDPCPEDSPVGDQTNMVFMGTVATRGKGRAVVVHTGLETEMGLIARLMESGEEEPTPLQKRLDQLGHVLVYACLVICALVVAVGIWRGESAYRMFLSGVSLAVAAIPEGLPAIVTVALALGVQRMVKRNAIVRRLPAVETLGCATVICSDKTGTLTQNEMTVRRLWTGGKEFEFTGTGYSPDGEITHRGVPVQATLEHELLSALKVAALCNNSTMQRKQEQGLKRLAARNSYQVIGDPTEGALLTAAIKGGLWPDQIGAIYKRLKEVPFDSTLKQMSVLVQGVKGEHELLVKGAPDFILDQSTHVLWQGKVTPLTTELRAAIAQVMESYGSNALRVLALAMRSYPRGYVGDLDPRPQGLTLVGLAGMIDPPRPEAKPAIRRCHEAGIRVIMITGDHKTTAAAVGREIGLIHGEEGVLTGKELDLLDDRQLADKLKTVSVFARVSPIHKLRLVQTLRSQGHVVAMTGDGVNDAPAIKEADIGVSMGQTGTDVTKEASSLILRDDNFATIVAAVEEGRNIYDNIRKFIRYLLSCNVGELLTMFLTIIAGLPIPLKPIQILWINLVTDGLPAMALGVDSGDGDVMRRPPRQANESIFARHLSTRIITRGLMIGISTVAVFVISLFVMHEDLVHARTVAFTTLVFAQLFHVFDCRSERKSVLEKGLFSNVYLLAAVASSVLLMLAVIYIPSLQTTFDTTPLGLVDWTVVLLAGAWGTILVEIRRIFLRPTSRRSRGRRR